MLFKTLSQKIAVLLCTVFLFFPYKTFADSLAGHWKFCYHDGQWLYNADIYLEKGATSSYFVTRDYVKHIPTHFLKESYIILKPGYEDIQSLKKSENYSSKDYVRLLGDLKFYNDKVIAVFEESIYGFSTKEYRLTLLPMGNHLTGSYDGRFVRPFKGEFEELYEHDFVGQEHWYKNIGKFTLCQERARDHLKKRYEHILEEKKKEIVEIATASAEKRAALVRALQDMVSSYTTDDTTVLKALKDPFVKVGHELLDLLIKIDELSQNPAIPYDQIDELRAKLDKTNAYLEMGISLDGPEVLKTFHDLISKADTLLTVANAFSPNSFEEGKFMDLIDLIPSEISPAITGAPGYMMKEILKWDIQGLGIASEGLDIIRGALHNKGWNSSLQAKGNRLDQRIQEWKKGPFEKSPLGFFEKIAEDIPLIGTIYRLFK